MRKDVLSLFLSATLICTMMPVEGAAQFASAAEQTAPAVEAVAQDQEDTGKITDSGTFGGEKNEETGEVTKEDTHKWAFAESTGVLTISGEGDMPNYTNTTYNTAPWYQYSSKIKKVIFEGNVTSTGQAAFRSYPSLEEVDLTGAENLTKLGSNCFYQCYNLKDIIGISQLTEIGDYALYSTALSGELVLPNIETLSAIYAFANTMITSISMPKLTSISNSNNNNNTNTNTFYNCAKLKTVNMPELTTITGKSVFEQCASLTELSMPKLTTGGVNTFYGCTSLKELSFPLLTSIGDNFACNDTALQTVSLPKAESIGQKAFQSCNLTEISLPEATKLGGSVFYGCISLKKISVPKLTSVTNMTFENCPSLTFIELPESFTSFGYSTMIFACCDSLERIYMKGEPSTDVPLNVMQDGYTKDESGSYAYLTDITIYVPSENAKSKWSAYTAKAGEDKVQVVSDWTKLKKENDLQISLDSYDITSPATPAVSKNTAGSSVTYQYYTKYSSYNNVKRFCLLDEDNPTAVPTIPGTYYVQACTEETEGYYSTTSPFVAFTVYGDITGDGWVYNNKTTTLTITDAAIMDNTYNSASEVPWYEYRASITKVAVREGVTLTKIAPYAFYDLTAVTEIALPDILESVGTYAFYYCQNWNRTNTLTIKELGNYSFQMCNNLAAPIILDNVTSIPIGAFTDCRNIPSIQVPDTVTSFGSRCFQNCSKITDIHIPEKVTTLPEAFISYTNIKNFTIPESITTIEYQALAYTNIFELTLPASLTTLKPGAFQYMLQLKEIHIPATVTTIEGKAQNNYGLFAGCKNLQTVIFDKTDYTTDTLGTCGALGWYDTNQDGKNDGQFTVDQMFYNTNDTLKVVCDGATYDLLKSYAETNTYWQNWNQTKMGWTSSKVLCNPSQLLETYTSEETAANNLVEADYKAELWSNLQTALTESKALAGTGDTLYEKYVNCRNAIKLIQRAVRGFLEDTWQSTEEILECDYYDMDTSDEEATIAWYTYLDAVDSAKTLLTDDELCSVDEYITCQQELKEAMSLIILLPTDTAVKELEALQTELTTLKEEDYTPESWKIYQDTLQEALQDVDKIKEEGTISQIQAVQKKLEEAKSALVKAAPLETPSPSTEPTKKPEDTPSPSTEPTKKPEDTPSPSTEPTKKPDNTPSPGTKPTQKPENNNTNKKPSVKKVSLKKVASKKKKTVVVRWKKLSGVSGYQIQLGRNKKFTKSKKTITAKKAKTVKKTVKKLKSKKKYYVRVRAYKTVSGKKYYGKWSKVKTVKVK